ncbi:MAG: ROK family protein [Treponema sp.]|nr:ROK family protein [Treponema sp.]MCL2271847.1 ROK family protein [Treponema sp.]
MRTVVLDIGGTVIKSGIFENENLSLKIKTPTNSHLGGPYIIEAAKNIIAGYTKFDSIGISTAGQVDSDKGVIRYANKNILDYTGMKVQEILQDAFNVPVAVENDVNAVAVGEVVFGFGKTLKAKDFLCLTYGTGVGGAIVYNGEVVKGASFSAGEFGHIITHGNKKENGYYEKYTSTKVLIGNVQKILPEIKEGFDVFRNIKKPGVKEIVDDWIDEILYGLASLIHVFDPAHIILGGAIMEEDYIIKSIRERINTHILPSYTNVNIVKAVLGNDAALWGVGHLAGLKK